MVDRFGLGDFVEHSTLGVGKIVDIGRGEARVYFKTTGERSPEKRTHRFLLPTDVLVRVEHFSDQELDNLPPWTAGQFVRFKTELDIQAARSRFLKAFPMGFDDPEYRRRERVYKASANQRYRNAFAPRVREWLEKRDASSLVAGLQAVYGDPTAPQGSPEQRLNLLFQRVEEPAYFEAQERGGDPLFRYINAALDFIESITPATFDAFVAGLLGLPTRPGGAHLDHWTTLTWLPFIARPDLHIFIKPTITRTFASVLPFEIHYNAELNYQTYQLAVKMAKRLGEELQESDLNLSGRHLDMIDVQSFMWVVIRYTEPELLGATD